jgi:hypothetical protein
VPDPTSPPLAVAPAASGIAGFVGRFARGPHDTVVHIESRQHLVEVFGPPLDDGPSVLVVDQFLRNGGTRARVIRTAGDAVTPEAVAAGVEALGAAGADLIAIPDAATLTPDEAATAYVEAVRCCGRAGAFLLIDPPTASSTPQQLHTWATRPELRSPDAALYAPGVVVGDPRTGHRRTVPASGSVAGVIARTDLTLGVWKAPAGTEARLHDVIGLGADLTSRDRELLNPVGVNLLRTFVGGAAPVVWGSRTLAEPDDVERRHVPVRRTTSLLRRSLERGLVWTVGRDNDEALWHDVRTAAAGLLDEWWRHGAFPADRPDRAYLVRCGLGATMTEADVLAGDVRVVVGVALVRPAEFTVVPIRASTRPVDAGPDGDVSGDKVVQRLPPGAPIANLPLSRKEVAALRRVIDAVRRTDHRPSTSRRPSRPADRRRRGPRIAVPLAGVIATDTVPRALAAELDREVLRVDLGRLVSRHIAETEANLSRLLDRASDSDAVLLFDEADALFGRRSEVRDAHDRAAAVGRFRAWLGTHPGIALFAVSDAAIVRRAGVDLDVVLLAPDA